MAQTKRYFGGLMVEESWGWRRKKKAAIFGHRPNTNTVAAEEMLRRIGVEEMEIKPIANVVEKAQMDARNHSTALCEEEVRNLAERCKRVPQYVAERNRFLELIKGKDPAAVSDIIRALEEGRGMDIVIIAETQKINNIKDILETYKKLKKLTKEWGVVRK